MGMRLSITAGFVAAALACHPGERENQSTDSAAPAVSAQLPDDVRAVCDSVATQWRLMPGVQVRKTDSTTAVNADSLSRHACVVIASAPTGFDSSRTRTSYWATRAPDGWSELLAWAADGPDGGSRTLRRASVLCQVDFIQDGGDDSDPAYVPSPAVREVTTCWPADRQGATQ